MALEVLVVDDEADIRRVGGRNRGHVGAFRVPEDPDVVPRDFAAVDADIRARITAAKNARR